MNWIITVIVIIILLAAAIWGLQRFNAARLKQLEQEVERVDTGELKSLIKSIANLGLAGDSLKHFTKLQRDYQKTAEKELAGLQSALLDAELENKQFQFVKFKATRSQLQAQIVEADAKLADIKVALQELQASESDTRAQLQRLHDDFQAARKTILAKSYAFDSALPALESELDDLAAELQTVTSVSDGGDHAAASDQMAALAVNVSTLQDHLERLPKLVNTVINEFPAQLEELQQGFAALDAQQYVFTLDIPAGIAAAKKQVDVAHQQLTDLAVDELATNVADTAASIDSLYAAMEKELNAKKLVLNQGAGLQQFIKHARKQNHTLQLELDHLNQSYTLTHGEINEANELAQQIEAIDTNFIAGQDTIEANTAIYSELLAQFTQANQDLQAIEKRHQAINAGVSDLQAREHQAVASADGFEMALRDIKYEVSRHQLPGLPRPYLDFFKVVTKELKALNHDLSQIKIDLDAIAKQLIQLGEDVEQLKDQSRTVIDSAGMCEQLLQYANRYKTSHPEVNEAATKAKASYQKYNYAEAADIIGSALETVEPGAYQKVEDDYLASKSASLF